MLFDLISLDVCSFNLFLSSSKRSSGSLMERFFINSAKYISFLFASSLNID